MDSQADRQFLVQVLQATAESRGDAQVVYPLLAANIEKLEYSQAEVLRHLATDMLAKVETDVAPSIASDIANFRGCLKSRAVCKKALSVYAVNRE